MLDEATARALSLIITAIGGPALLISAGRSLWKWWTGRAGRERSKNKQLVDDREHEAAQRRKTEEYASRLRRQMFEAGVEPEEWPEELTVPRAPRKRPRQTGAAE